MTNAEKHDRVVSACREVLNDPGVPPEPEGYESLALCILDAVWSLGVRYGSVENVVRRYRNWLRAHGDDASVRTAGQLTTDIAAVGGPKAFAADVVRNHALTSSRGGVLKAVAVADAANRMVRSGVQTVTDLRVRASDMDVEAAWRAVKGQGSGISWHYLRILAGVDDVKADRMVVAFVSRAAECSVTPANAQQMLKTAYTTLLYEYPALTLRGLDHAVWSAERVTRRRTPRRAV